MAVVVFSKSVPFPVGLLRTGLSRFLPLYRWQIGEEDKGEPEEMGRFRDHDLITGRSSNTVIFTELRAHQERFAAPAPDHVWHLVVGQPTTELKPVSDRILAMVCITAMSLDGEHGWCQLKPGGNWLSGADMKKLLELVLRGEDLAISDGLGIPPDRLPGAGGSAPAFAPAAPPVSAPSITSSDPSIMRQMLPPLVLMLDRPLVPDWRQIEDFARTLDAEGGWKHVAAPDGANLLCGRGTRIIVTDKAEPVPACVYEEDFARCFWFKGDRAAIAAHRRHATVGTALDTAAADWVTIRQVAKVVTLVCGVLARLPGTVAVHNLGVGTIFEPHDVGGFLSILARDQLPVQFWTYSLWHSLEAGDVSVSTSGLEPFLGHEIEAWNVPLTREEVVKTVSDLIIYLLDKGPVIGHGDTAGRTAGDQAIRCFRGPSRAERPRPVQSLFLEFREERVEAPKPDLPTAAAQPVSDAEAARIADQMIGQALGEVMQSASPEMRRILGEVRDQRRGAAPPPAGGAPQPAPPSAPGFPPRRAGGFGRKGL